MSNPTQPDAPGQNPGKTDDAAEIKPSEIEVGRALGEIEQATKTREEHAEGPASHEPDPWWLRGDLPVVLWFAAFVLLAGLLAVGLQFGAKKLLASVAKSGGEGGRPVLALPASAGVQADAERLLERLAAGDSAAAVQVLAQSGMWISKTHRTAKANQMITTALSSSDMRVREAALQAELAMDGVAWNAIGLQAAERAAENPSSRAWALWTLGALGNRGVDPSRTGGLIASYLSDPDEKIRASAVNGLALLGTDPTIPLLLDRFRNDTSPFVQEEAACGLAQAGMYTHQQQMNAAGNLVNLLDDPHMTNQQRGWALQALRDISGQNFGGDSAAWRQWFENAR